MSLKQRVHTSVPQNWQVYIAPDLLQMEQFPSISFIESLLKPDRTFNAHAYVRHKMVYAGLAAASKALVHFLPFHALVAIPHHGPTCYYWPGSLILADKSMELL